MKTSLQAFSLIVAILATTSKISELCQDIDSFNEANKDMWENQPLEKVYGESTAVVERERDGLTKAIPWKLEDQTEKMVFVKRIVSESPAEDVSLARYIRNLFILEEEELAVKVIGCIEKTVEVNLQIGTEAAPVYEMKPTSAVYIITESFYGAFDERRIHRNALKILQRKNSVTALRVFLGMAQSLQALHSRQLIHGHIRPSSFVAKDSKLAHIKIWNLQHADAKGNQFQGNSTIFTPFLSNANNDLLTPEIDVYAFAMSLASIEIGDHWLAKVVANTPKKDRTAFLDKLRNFILINFRKIRNYRRIISLKDGLTDIMHDCLSPDPAARPSIDQLITRLTIVVERREKERAEKALIGKPESPTMENDRQFPVTMEQDPGVSILGESTPVDQDVENAKSLIRQTTYYTYAFAALVALAVAGIVVFIVVR
jgi:hypothetical protein